MESNKVAVVFLLIIAVGIPLSDSALAQPDSHFQSANDSIQTAFNAVLDAEKAGANVTNLIKQLNDASNLLSAAENAYRSNDPTTANINEAAIYPITGQVLVEAQELKGAALTSASNNFWFNISLTVIVATVFAVIMLICWRYFKKRYTNSILKAKPEVILQ